MRTALIALLALACFLSLGACNGEVAPNSATSPSADDPVTQDIKEIEYGVRLAAANKRIDELERRVGALEDTPEKLNLDLLTQRVIALEVRSNDAIATVSTNAPLTGKAQPVDIEPRKSGEVRRATMKATKLNLPHLEKRAALATPSEAKAFSSKPQP
jgi:hypothetical protein